MSSIRAIYLGLVGYNRGLQLQNMLIESHKLRAFMIKEGKPEPFPNPNTILLLQHKPVYTIGIRQKDPANDYTDKAVERLRSLGAEFVRTDRGGLITFHGPGQLVAYPILNLRSAGLQSSVRWYVEALERSIIATCSHFGVTATRTCDVGVWIGAEKIAAIGVRTSNGVTSHGLALNCTTDLTWFSHIVPCGLPDRGVTSLSRQLGRPVRVEEALGPLTTAMEASLGCPIRLEEFPGVEVGEEISKDQMDQIKTLVLG